MERRGTEHEESKRRRTILATGIVATTLLVAVGGIIANQYNQSSPDAGQSHETQGTYPWHHDVTATKFWIGEEGDESNDNISNVPTFWVNDAVKAYGGVDDPNERCALLPCKFTPHENAFYFALPFGDYADDKPKPPSDLSVVPWYDGQPLQNNESILKNRWIEITYGNKKAYAQWEDVGPFNENDADSVFGTSKADDSRAGLDLSPATADYLGFTGVGTENGRETVSWRFIEESKVPDGPWKDTVTISGPQWD